METRVCKLYGQNDLRVETAPLTPPQSSEVLVALGAGGICGSDLHYWQDGGFGPIRVKEPIILGHEAAGTIIALGPDVTGLNVGDQVALNPSHPCGTCRFCAAGHHNHCLNMRFKGSAMRLPHEQGMFRDKMVINAAQCHKILPHISIHQAACAEPLAVCLHAFNKAVQSGARIEGARVLITGAGPIGALCTALARHFGAAEITVTDIQDATLHIATQMGATQTCNMAQNPHGLDDDLQDKGQFDIVFECSGAPSALKFALQALRPMGHFIQVGVSGDIPFALNFLVGKEINLIGSHRFHGEFADSVALINSQTLPLAAMITQCFPLDQAHKAFVTAADRSQSVKVQLTFN